MRAFGRSRRRKPARLCRFDRLLSFRNDALFALMEEFVAGDRALRTLLERDGRDTEDVPGFDDLADRQAELVGLICATPARSLAAVVAKARCARLHPTEQGFDAAFTLALSACDDLLRLASTPVLRRSLLLPTSARSAERSVETSGRADGP